MKDYRINWMMPELPLGPARRYVDIEHTTDTWPLFEFERHNRPAYFATDLSKWKDGNPPAAGWYIVGSTKDNYSATIRAKFNGSEWTEWVGLVDPRVRGPWKPELVKAYRVKWFVACVPQDFANDPEHVA